MSERTYGVFMHGDKVLCYKAENGWELPSTTEPTCYANFDPFKKVVLSDYQRDLGVHCPGMAWVEFFVSPDKKVVLASQKEIYWAGKDDFDTLEWNPSVKPIINDLKTLFIEHSYRITELNQDGTEELMWSGKCYGYVWQREFHRLVIEQGNAYNAPGNKKPWRQVRAYNDSGELIRTES